MCVKSLPRESAALIALSTTERFHPTHGWIPCTGIDDIVFQMFLWNTAGNFQARPAIQFAEARTNEPGAASGVGTATSTDGAHRFSTTPSTGSQFYVRFGVMYSLSAGTTEGYGEVALIPTFHDLGRTLPMRSVTLNPGDGDTTQLATFPVTEPLPTVGISKAKYAVTIEQNANTYLEYVEVCRIFRVDAEPGSWALMDSVTYTQPDAGNSDRNTGEMDFPVAVGVSNQNFVQLGIAVRQSDAANLRAILRIQPAVIY